MSTSRKLSDRVRTGLQPLWGAAKTDGEPVIGKNSPIGPANTLRSKETSRDGNRCQFCGLVSARYHDMYKVGLDQGSFPNRQYVTACNLCRLVQICGIRKKTSVGFLAWIPELTQTEINHVVRFCMFTGDGAGKRGPDSPEPDMRARKLERLYQLLRTRPARIKVGDVAVTLTPENISEFLSRNQLTEAQHAVLARSLRFVPHAEAFEEAHRKFVCTDQAEHYAQNTWARAYDRLTTKLAATAKTGPEEAS